MVNFLDKCGVGYFSSYSKSPMIEEREYNELKSNRRLLLFLVGMSLLIIAVMLLLGDTVTYESYRLAGLGLVMIGLGGLSIYYYIFMRMRELVGRMEIGNVEFDVGRALYIKEGVYLFLEDGKMEDWVSSDSVSVGKNDYVVTYIRTSPEIKESNFKLEPNVSRLKLECHLYCTEDYYKELKRRAIR